MDKTPEIEPLVDGAEIDRSGTLEERLTRLEGMIHAIATHQTTLGVSLITCHGKVLEHAAMLEAGGVREAAELYTAEQENRSASILAGRPAPLIHPGGHPLSKGK